MHAQNIAHWIYAKVNEKIQNRTFHGRSWEEIYQKYGESLYDAYIELKNKIGDTDRNPMLDEFVKIAKSKRMNAFKIYGWYQFLPKKISEQGIKIHAPGVKDNRADANLAIAVVVSYLLLKNVPFKVASEEMAIKIKGGKQNGKEIAIYTRNEGEAKEICEVLHAFYTKLKSGGVKIEKITRDVLYKGGPIGIRPSHYKGGIMQIKGQNVPDNILRENKELQEKLLNAMNFSYR